MEKLIEKMEHCENGSELHCASCYTVMKHITGETKTFKDLDAV